MNCYLYYSALLDATTRSLATGRRVEIAVPAQPEEGYHLPYAVAPCWPGMPGEPGVLHWWKDIPRELKRPVFLVKDGLDEYPMPVPLSPALRAAHIFLGRTMMLAEIVLLVGNLGNRGNAPSLPGLPEGCSAHPNVAGLAWHLEILAFFARKVWIEMLQGVKHSALAPHVLRLTLTYRTIQVMAQEGRVDPPSHLVQVAKAWGFQSLSGTALSRLQEGAKGEPPLDREGVAALCLAAAALMAWLTPWPGEYTTYAISKEEVNNERHND